MIPTGPPAMVLVSIAELVDVDQGAVAGCLIVSVRTLLCRPANDDDDESHGEKKRTSWADVRRVQYLFSPVTAIVCSFALSVVQAVAERTPGV